MEASELRIGNWYLSTKFQTPVICEMGDFYEIYMRADGSSEYTVDDIFEPLPLTEEWLLKFGFEKIGGYLWDCKKLGENRFLNNPFSPTHFEVRGFIPKSHIQYVHQLQNLYFALTGEELIIK